MLTNGRGDCYQRVHGDSDWISVGAITDASIVLSSYYQVAVSNIGAHPGAVCDSILLAAGPAPTPEPSAMMIMVTGVAGLLAYAWRKRR